MFKRFADAKHKAQAERFLLSLGNFVLAFERVCASMRFLVMLVLQKQGLKNQGMQQVIISGLAARSSSGLRELLAALLAEFPGLDKDDHKAVKEEIMDSIEEVTKKRNLLVHSDWDLGVEAAEEEFTAASFRFKAKPSRGAFFEEHWYSVADVEDWTRKAEKCQVLLSRLQYCINQSGFKVATELRKPL